MARFLSAAWFAQLQREQPDHPDAPALILQQVVTATPEGDVRYLVAVGTDGARVTLGTHAEPDMTFTSDYRTATAVARGELSVQAALSAGRIRVGGDTARLAAHQPFPASFDPFPAWLRATTDWDDDTGDPHPPDGETAHG